MGLPVLVVDDDESIGKVFQVGFRDSDVEIFYFSNPLEALQWARDCSPALAVIDMLMPEMTGLELCRELRSCPETQDTPIILISSMDKSELKAVAAQVGASCVAKPFATKEVFDLMRARLALAHSA